MMTSYIWHCFCTYCTKNTGIYYISALSCHTAPVGHNSVLSKTKTKTKTEAGLRPVLS